MVPRVDAHNPVPGSFRIAAAQFGKHATSISVALTKLRWIAADLSSPSAPIPPHDSPRPTMTATTGTIQAGVQLHEHLPAHIVKVKAVESALRRPAGQ